MIRIATGVVLAAAAAALAAGCGGGGGSSATTGSSSAAYVVLVTDINQLNDPGFNQLAYKGLKNAERDLGIRGDVYQSPSAQDYIPNLAQAARKGADLVNTVGSVGGEKQPPVDRYIAGYQAGARKADPGVKLLNAYSQDWVDQAKCKQAALDQIASGANVVFQVAGGCGLGVLDAAKERRVWGI